MNHSSDVFVITVDGRYLVRPAAAIVRQGQNALRFRNLTGSDVVLEFPSDVVRPREVRLSPDAQVTVEVHSTKAGAFGYRARVEKVGVDAQGNSGPIFIVDR